LSYNGKQVQVKGTTKATKKTSSSAQRFTLPMSRRSRTSANRSLNHSQFFNFS
jgi:hypothetical protein